MATTSIEKSRAVKKKGDPTLSLLDMFSQLVQEDPGAPMMHFADDKGRIQQALNRSELDIQSRQIAAMLRQHKLLPGDRVLLVYDFSIDVIPAVLGCFSAGVIPCPVAPPNPIKLANDLSRFEQLAADSGCKAVLTNRKYKRYRTLANLRSPRLIRGTAWKNLPWLKTDTSLPEPIIERHRPTPEDTAFIQYTSGSTSTPKGVMVSFRNLHVQIEMIRERCPLVKGERTALWIPYYHDHCLVGFILNHMFYGGQMYLMSPLTFLKRPATWFELLEATRATCTASPNFAFNYAVSNTTEEQRAQWDLSSIEIFQSGGEPVQVEAVDNFKKAFAKAKLRPETVSSAYGMAEHVLGIAVGGRNRISIDRKQYEQAHRIVISNKPGNLTLLGNGPALSDVRVEIVDPDTRQKLDPGNVGEIWIDSLSKASGYWNKPELNAEVFNAQLADDSSGTGFLRTGDLGFFYENELYVSGRIKDTIIIRGRNIFPQDVETVVGDAHESVRPGRTIAFASSSTEHGEHLSVITELQSNKLNEIELKEIVDLIRQTVTASLSVSCHTVVLVSADTIFKTTSGKLQRSKTREHFHSGKFADKIFFESSLPADNLATVQQQAPKSLTEDVLLARMVEHIASLDDSDPELINCDAPLQNLALDSLATIGLVLDTCSWAGRDFAHELITDATSLRAAARALAANAQLHEPTQQVNATQQALTPHTENNTAPQVFPLNPSQAWLLEPGEPTPHAWTVGGMVQTPESIDEQLMQQAADVIIEHHDALRLRLVQKDGCWEQHLLNHDRVSIDVLDLSALNGASLRNEIENTVNTYQHDLNMSDGPIVRLVIMHLNESQSDRLLLLTHHIAVDAYSFELIAADLIRVYEQLLDGNTHTLTPPRTSYTDWMETLVQFAASEEVTTSSQIFTKMPIAPRVKPDNPLGKNNDGNMVAKSEWLPDSTSNLLLRVLPTTTGLPTATIVLTALLQALYEHTGEVQHGFELVHHGRKNVVPNTDLSLTGGWVSVNCPFALLIEPDADFIDYAHRVQQCIDQVPRNGLDYGLLRYLHPDENIRQQMKLAVQPESKFMWYGQNPGMLQSLASRYPRAPESVATGFNADRPAHYLRYFYGTVSDSAIRLDVMSSNESFKDSTRAELLQLWLHKITALHSLVDS